MTHLNDEEIVALVQKGDIESFGILMQRFESKLLRYGRKFLASRDDITDLVQEVFIKAYRNIQSFDLSRRFSPWIYRIAHNEFVNGLKRSKSIDWFSFDIDEIFPHPVALESADSDSLKKELEQDVTSALEKISIKYREVVILFYFEGLGY